MDPNSNFTDCEYLRNEQYQDGNNLRSRASLHEHYSTNPIGWHTWVFAQLDLPPSAAILEVGCGPGFLWAQNQAIVPRAWQVLLSDFSPGMVSEARLSLHSSQNFAYLCFDVGHAPLLTGRFDGVIANHMLYHVPDVDRALSMIYNLLKPGGKLYATTNGRSHLQEIASFVGRARQEPSPGSDNVFQRSTENFSLQSGRQKLNRLFGEVELRHYPDSIEVDDTEAVVQFVESSSVFGLSTAGLARLRELLQEEIELKGTVHITKEAGIFIATKANA